MVNQTPENTITGFQLKDILDKNKKVSEVRKKIYEVVLFNKRFMKTISHSYDHVEEEEEKKEKEKSKNIKFDIVKFLTDIGASECMKKL